MMNLAALILSMIALATAVKQQPGQPQAGPSDSHSEALTIPRMLSYQGRLTDTLGNAVPNGVYSLSFRLYATPTGGSPFWTETQNLAVRGGVFNALLGSVTPLGTVPDGGALYLGMAVGGEAEMVPRVRIVSAAYAYKADTAGYALASPGGGSPYNDSANFRNCRVADTAKTLYARQAWVEDTTLAAVFRSTGYVFGNIINPTETTGTTDVRVGRQVGAAGEILTYWYYDRIAADTLERFRIHGPAGFMDYQKRGHASIVNWDGFENIDTVRRSVSGNPVRRAFHGFAWCDTGIDRGAGFAGIWQYESTRVVAMAESIDGGTKSFVAAIGSTRGNFADTSYMHSSRGFYTNRAYVGPGSVVPGTVITWYGDSSALPAGYALCDGAARFTTLTGESVLTPDLRGSFSAGAAGQLGAAASATAAIVPKKMGLWLLIRSRDW